MNSVVTVTEDLAQIDNLYLLMMYVVKQRVENQSLIS
jgi:hypothetical protein